MEKFNEDSLIGAAANLDAAGYLIQALREDFMTKYDPDTNPKDRMFVAYSWSRYRAIVWALEELLLLIRRDFEKYGIDPYEPRAQDKEAAEPLPSASIKGASV